MSDPELEDLTRRVDALEREVQALRYGLATGTAAPPPAPEPARTPAFAAAPAPPAAPVEPRRDIEALIGGRGLLYAGSLLILLGMSWFLKIAFDRGWIGPEMRVSLGILAGIAVVAGATVLRKRLHPVFADALVGLGAAIEYLALYAAGSMFHLLPLGVVALGTTFVTATLCVLAARQNRATLAYVGIVGGLIAPMILGGDAGDTLLLYAYLGALAAGAIALGELRGWRGVPIVALCGTLVYWLGFAFASPDEHKISERILVAVLLYALFASTTFIAALRKEKIDGWRTALFALNAAWFFIGIASLGIDDHALLAIVFLGIAAAHVAIGAALKQRQQFWLATIALSFAIPPICYAFDLPGSGSEELMLAAWILLATAAGVLGARRNDRGLVVLSGAVFAAAILRALGHVTDDDLRLVLNVRFLGLAGSALGLTIVRREALASGAAKGAFNTVVRILVDLVALIAIVPEAWRLGGQLSPAHEYAAQSVAQSIVMGVYAVALIVAGIRTQSAASRWEGLALMAFTFLHVFVNDLTEVDVVFRVVAALGLGVVALIVAFLYQSRLRATKGAS